MTQSAKRSLHALPMQVLDDRRLAKRTEMKHAADAHRGGEEVLTATVAAQRQIAALEAAMATRSHAFHEAGHVWAAYRSGLSVGTASITTDQPRLITEYSGETAWIATAGYLAQALLIEADYARVNLETWARNCNGSHVSPLSPHPDDHDISSLLQHVDCIHEKTCCCRRGGDESVSDFFKDESWILFQLPRILTEWPLVEALASRLMSGDVHSREIVRCLSGAVS